ncbi:MAG TPA: hypothetical protein VNL18_08210 [Gemmatimonadales bacterium]|nr:hypothetical protein [Gemmatimonadales bacterium]
MKVAVWSGLVAGVVALLGALTARFKAPSWVDPVRPDPSPSLSVPPYPESLAVGVIARDVFRFGRRPSPMAYDPMRDRHTSQAVTAPPRPVLTLVGIVAGPDPSAAIEGFPGVDGARVVRVGDEMAGLKVARIGKSEVRIVGLDTVWVLQVREPWK